VEGDMIGEITKRERHIWGLHFREKKKREVGGPRERMGGERAGQQTTKR